MAEKAEEATVCILAITGRSSASLKGIDVRGYAPNDADKAALAHKTKHEEKVITIEKMVETHNVLPTVNSIEQVISAATSYAATKYSDKVSQEAFVAATKAKMEQSPKFLTVNFETALFNPLCHCCTVSIKSGESCCGLLTLRLTG